MTENGMTLCEDESRARRLSHSEDFFTNMLATIPAKWYFSPEDQEQKSKFIPKRQKDGPGPKQALKEASKKARKAKLNPQNNKTVPQILQEKQNEEKETESEKSVTGQKRKRDSLTNGKAEEGEHDEEEDGVEEEGENDGEKAEESDDGDDVDSGFLGKDLGENGLSSDHAANGGRVTSLDGLHERLHAKIKALRAQRNADDKQKQTPRGAKPPPAKKQKKKQQKPTKEEKQQQNKPKQSGTATKRPNAETPNLQFGTFDFSSGAPTPTYLLKQKKRQSKKVLLKKLEASSGPKDEAQRLDEAWQKTMLKAKGEKVLDNAKLLKKSIKREESKKKKSKKAWDARKKEEKKQQAAKQKKRNDNIAEYLEKKKARRMKGKKKAATKRPGFEGSKKSFITK
ncbi:Ribosomal RNA-processing protein 14 [Balamuthia mandrillaris]